MSTILSIASRGLSRGGIEIKQFFRERETVVFTFAMPAVLLLLLGSILSQDIAGINGSVILAPSIAAAGIASTSFVNLGTAIATERDDGTLKRLHGMPVSSVAYFLGKIILVLVAGLAELILMLLVAVIAFDMSLPTDVEKWLTLAWLFVLGCSSCALLGIAASSLTRTARGSGAVVMMPFIVLEFISGVFVVPVSLIPSPLREIGAVFPLKWLAQGFRYVFLPDRANVIEAAGDWELGRVALVLALWCVVGLGLCLTTFRWRSRLTR